jgi:hypothetical protein
MSIEYEVDETLVSGLTMGSWCHFDEPLALRVSRRTVSFRVYCLGELKKQFLSF